MRSYTRGMAERDWKQRWMDPTLLGRRWRWYMTACALSLVAIYLLVGPYPVDVGRYGPRLCLGLIVSFVLGAMYAARWHRRIATQAKDADHQMCKFCGYDLRNTEEPGPCPECGRKFEVADLRDYWERKFEGRS